MRWLLCLMIVLCLAAASWGEQVVERQGWKVLTFDVPGMELLGQKDSRITRATYAKKVGDGEVKITVYIKSWMAIDTFEATYRDEKIRARASGDSRLREAIEIPGASKVLTYSSTAPFEAEVIVLYSKDFRCQLTITGRKDGLAEVEPTYQQLARTLKMGGLSPISPIRVESQSDPSIQTQPDQESSGQEKAGKEKPGKGP
jgi:hypothetical protein